MTVQAANRVAKVDRQCSRCRAVIPVGSRYWFYREPALTSYEARHAGRYPARRVCLECLTARNNDALIERAEDDYVDRAAWKAHHT